MSKAKNIIKIMNPDKTTGTSDWWKIKDLEKLVGYALTGNGAADLQNDRGVGKFHTIQKQYSTNPRAIESVRLTGFAPHHQNKAATYIPQAVRKWFKGYSCAVCNTTSKIEIDHRDGNKQPIKAITTDFQALCTHCNKVKREKCKKCKTTGLRFDAKNMGFKKSWTIGNKTFQPRTPRCKGCFWENPQDFRKKA